MNPLAFARANGWPQLASRLSVGSQRRLRDRWTAARLQAPGFRAGRSPRLLGLSHMRIGADFHAGDALWLEAVLQYGSESYTPRLEIGPHARLSDNVHIGCLNRIVIGAHLLSGSHVLISDHAHGRYTDARGGAVPGEDAMAAAVCAAQAIATGAEGRGAICPLPHSDPAVPPALRPLFSPAPVVLGDNVWLGDGVAVLAGAVIGDGCVIGANSVVNGVMPPRTLAVGAPARPVRRWDEARRRWVSFQDTP